MKKLLIIMLLIGSIASQANAMSYFTQVTNYFTKATSTVKAAVSNYANKEALISLAQSVGTFAKNNPGKATAIAVISPIAICCIYEASVSLYEKIINDSVAKHIMLAKFFVVFKEQFGTEFEINIEDILLTHLDNIVYWNVTIQPESEIDVLMQKTFGPSYSRKDIERLYSALRDSLTYVQAQKIYKAMQPNYAAAALVAAPLYKVCSVMSKSMPISDCLNNYVNSCTTCSDLRSKGFQKIILNNDIPQEIKRIVFAITNNENYTFDQMKEQLVALSKSLTGKLIRS